MPVCKVYLPSKARIADVADVLAILTWCKPSPVKVSTKHFLSISSLEVYTEYSPTSTSIKWNLGGTGSKCSKTFFFEFGNGFHGMSFVATDIGLAIAKRLVDFFGGKVQYSVDSKTTSGPADYSRPVRPDLCSEDHSVHNSLQERKMKLKAITQKEINAAREHAYYFKVYGGKTVLAEPPQNGIYEF